MTLPGHQPLGHGWVQGARLSDLTRRALAALLMSVPPTPEAHVPPPRVQPRRQRKRYLLHQELRRNAIQWLQREATGATPLPEVLTADEMMEALGCGDQAFYSWLRAGLLPGGRGWPGGVWRCTVAAFVCWLSTDAYWFPPSPPEL